MRMEYIPKGYEWLKNKDTKTIHKSGFYEYGHFDSNKDNPNFKAIFESLKEYIILIIKHYTDLGDYTIFIKK